MAPKHLLDKGAWQWAETTDPCDITDAHILTAYRLELKPCQASKCRKNCKGNPHCLVHLGEREWLGEIDDRYWHDIGDPAEETREPGNFVGLKNLGATCYVNTFLQVNLFLHAMLLCIIYISSYIVVVHSSLTPPPSPTTICGHLQHIFALLSFSQRRYLDPTPLIECLKLDSSQQQDAQEFSKLLIMLLEDQLSSSGLSHLVRDNFMGTYHYVTQCHVCGNESRTPSKFYELDLNIKGHKTLQECIAEFLKEEKMEGDDKYMCDHCQCKQNATRKIQLQSLPPVLNIQLLRFVFDRKTGHKKKLNSFIQFPETLDMSSVLSEPEGSRVYSLKAVLIHSGPSAYSGHYTAHIHDTQKEAWFKFNDEVIEKMKSKGLELGAEEDFGMEGKSAAKKPRTGKGLHSSRNAYMLVYTLDSSVHGTHVDVQLDELPKELQELIQHDNDAFAVWLKELSVMKEVNISRGHDRVAEVKNILSKLPAPSGELKNSEWILSGWIQKWLGCDHSHQVPKIDNSSLLCIHNRLNPDMVNAAKCISEEASELIYAKYEGGPRLKVEASLCQDCVKERCKEIRSKARLTEDGKAIASMLKSHPEVSTGVWVGKVSLRSWKKMATDKMKGVKETILSKKSTLQFEFLETCDEDIDVKENSNESETSERLLTFNEDLLCEDHGNLSPDVSCRKLVPQDIWTRLQIYFPGVVTYSSDAEPCAQCLAAQAGERAQKDRFKTLAMTLKSALANLYLNKQRPIISELTSKINLVPTQFIMDWRQFIKDSINKPFTETIPITPYLCRHGGFLYFLENTTFPNCLTAVYPSEWVLLSRYSKPDGEISIQRNVSDCGKITLSVTPDVCQECCLAREREEVAAQFSYKDAAIYIRKSAKEDVSAFANEATDPENGSNDEKRKLDDQTGAPPSKQSRLDVGPSRKSSRHRHVRGEKKIEVDACNTLRDLKLKIMKVFSVPPFDQNLICNGRELKGNTDTLAALHILPGDVIYLQADEPVEDPMFLEDATKASVPETGFLGTGLVSR
ncbi:hypothetical protein CAPTEDRAFT_178380 [Capitella teleta]|uniref:Ubiquitin carboxyl-terminal hydrolase 48 n=1 Tax=Capitella teleta TaxID=283909 RepID=R7VKI3_CAPTE|nr:hypothetical protein CAPTEDRAFT_178380 [Capitella teleta]|eukprot:ELU17396.1 hypothetical protein CAPTEDRAFT_178380 [Capitella teleta]